MEAWVAERADGAWEMVAPVPAETAEAAVAQREEKEEGEGEEVAGSDAAVVWATERAAAAAVEEQHLGR